MPENFTTGGVFQLRNPGLDDVVSMPFDLTISQGVASDVLGDFVDLGDVVGFKSSLDDRVAVERFGEIAYTSFSPERGLAIVRSNGPVLAKKATGGGKSIAKGVKVYYNPNTKNVETASTSGNVLVGYSLEAAETTDLFVLIDFDGTLIL